MNNFFKLMASAGFFFLLCMTSLGGTAIASTPDGSTPANQDVCNELMADGVTKGLYGLCVAYCEAQDLNSFDKQPPSDKILQNYNQKKTATDPEMPCRFEFGCFSQAEIEMIPADPTTTGCTPPAQFRTGDNIEYGSLYRSVRIKKSIQNCGYKDETVTPAIIRNQIVTDPQVLNAAYSAIEAKCIFIE